MEIPIINDLAKGLLLDRIRRWFGQRDQRRALIDELAVELLEYRGKLAAGRLVLQSGLPDALRALGGSDYAQQLRPPPRLLELISPKYMAHEIPLAEALNAILGLVNTTVDAMVLGRQVGGEDPVDDQVIARLLELSDECIRPSASLSKSCVHTFLHPSSDVWTQRCSQEVVKLSMLFLKRAV